MFHRAFLIALLTAIMVGSLGYAEEPAKQAAEAEKAAPAASAEEIASWISQLDDHRYLIREQATRQLLDAGNVALDPLLQTANGERPEPADRAVWILRRLARSRDNDQSIAALERLVQLRGRPLLVERAEAELGERSIAVCQARLAPLGAEVTMEATQLDALTIVPLLHVRLTEKWRGTPDDLRVVAELPRQFHFRFEGEAVDNQVAKLFENKERLAFMQFLDTKITPDAVDGLKAKHRDAIIYVRGQALLGVEAKNHPAGAIVIRVEPGTAAANAEIVAGDVITSMDGHTLPDFDRLTARIAQHQPGEAVDVEILRGTERKKISVTLGSWAERE